MTFPSASAAPPPPRQTSKLTVEQVWPGVNADPELLTMMLEESCIVSGSAACKMSKSDIASMLPDIEADTKELHDLIANDPEAKPVNREIARPVFIPGLVSRIGSIAKKAKEVRNAPALNRLGARTDDLNHIATAATRTKDWLGAGVEVPRGDFTSLGKAVVGAILDYGPVIGDIYSLGMAIGDGNVHDGVCAAVSLLATAISLVVPPLGAVIGAAVTVYQLGKFLWGLFQAEARPRDWIENPPGTVQELFESGATITTESTIVAGESVNLAFPRRGLVATQTILLDSRWTKTNNTDRPVVKYGFSNAPPNGAFHVSFAWFHEIVREATLNLWQDGNIYNAKCRGATHEDVVIEESLGRDPFDLTCEDMEGSPTISKDHPAVITVSYLYDSKNLVKLCDSPPCVHPWFKSSLHVIAEGKSNIEIHLNGKVGVL